MRSSILKHRKISPLQILSKFKKSNRFQTDIDVVNINLAEQGDKKHRYDTQINQDGNESVPNIVLKGHKKQLEIGNSFQNMKQKSKSSKFRYYSVQRDKMAKSPYKTPQKPKQLPKNLEPSQILFSKIRKKIQINRSTKHQRQPSLTQPSTNALKNNPQKLINKQFNNHKDIIQHYVRLKEIYSQITTQKKYDPLTIINCIRQYILENSQASYLQEIYICQNSKRMIRNMLYYQRVSILLIIECIITEKYKLHQHHFRSIISQCMALYLQVFFMLGSIHSHTLSHPSIKQDIQLNKQQLTIKAQTLQLQLFLKKSFETLSNKLKFLLRYCKSIDLFLKSQLKILYNSDFTSNLLYYNLLEYFSFYLLAENCMGWNIQFLQTCPSPYLHNNTDKKYTLVLDMDQTLIHYKMTTTYNGQFLIRPYLYQFLHNLSKYFEIGIFTCSLPQYADIILNHLSNISFRLYRHHTIQINGQYVKDLSRIGRDLSKMIIVDNIQKNFRLQKNNGIFVKSWYGDKKDIILKKVQRQLLGIVQKNIQDVRYSQHCRTFL